MGSTSGHTSHRGCGARARRAGWAQVFPRFVVVAGGVGSEAREDARQDLLARGDGGVGGGVGGL